MYLFRSTHLNGLLAGFFVVFACILAFHADSSATAANKGIQVKAKTPDGGSEEIDLYLGSHALLIGVSNYTGGWPKLESVPAELASVESALKAKGFTVDKYIDPTHDQMFRAFERFINSYGYVRENRLLFYFSGHGHTFQDGRKGYLVPADAPNPEKDKVGFLQKALGMNQVLAWARDIEAKHALFLFDSCFSGTVFKQRDLPAKPLHISRATALPVRQFITAGSAGEPVPAASTFTPVVIDALKFKWGDLNNDGYVSATELGLYLQEEVPRHVAQHPQYGKIPDYELSRGDFIFLAGGIIVTQEPSPQRPKSGSMKIRSQPTGTSVYINEKYRGKAPVLLKDLSPGTFRARVKLEGYKDQEKNISVRAGRTASVQFFLDELAKKGRLYVTTEPEDARIKILNITPQYHKGIELDAGRYHIEVSKTDYETENRWVKLAAGEDLDVQIRLKPKVVSAAKPSYSSSSGKEAEWRDPVTGMEFVWVPGGCYQMGCGSWTDHCGSDEKPVHEVCVDGFWIGRYEVTQGQWKRIMGNYSSNFKKGDNYPVEVSWNDAKKFIKRLNTKSNGNYEFCLPTEAEWEYACRSGGKAEEYCGSSDIDSLAWYEDNSGGSTHPVGTKKPNGLGIYDMSGNVWEWCEDIYADDAYNKHSRNNPVYAGGGTNRVKRGGGRYYAPRSVRSADRSWGYPGSRYNYEGFRLVMKDGNNFLNYAKGDLTGTWKGRGCQSNGSCWSILINIPPYTDKVKGGTIEYPSLDCKARLEFVGWDNNTAVFRERYIKKGSCVTDGWLYLTPIGINKLDYVWAYPDGREEARAEVTRVE